MMGEQSLAHTPAPLLTISEWKLIWVSITRWTGKWKVVSPHNGVSFGLRREEVSATLQPGWSWDTCTKGKNQSQNTTYYLISFAWRVQQRWKTDQGLKGRVTETAHEWCFFDMLRIFWNWLWWWLHNFVHCHWTVHVKQGAFMVSEF